jgi:hypothetical protein
VSLICNRKAVAIRRKGLLQALGSLLRRNFLPLLLKLRLGLMNRFFSFYKLFHKRYQIREYLGLVVNLLLKSSASQIGHFKLIFEIRNQN